MTSIDVDDRAVTWRSTQSSPVVPWWCVATPAVLFVLLALVCGGANTLDLDLQVSRWVQARNASWADPLSTIGNTIGEAPLAIGFLVAALVVTGLLKRWADIWFLVLAAVGRLLTVPLKGWFDSPRPASDQVKLLDAWDTYGFPSGHTLTSTIVAGTIVVLIARQFPRRHIRPLLAGFWLLAICCTAFARMWVGAHWLTDTIGGALLGIVIVLMAARLSTILVNRWPGTTAGSDR